jgi:DNA replication protein DnaC
MASLSTKDAEMTCERHGKRAVMVFKLYSDDWSPARCDLCEAEEAVALKAAEEARHKADIAAMQKRMLEKRLNQSAIPARFTDRSFDSYMAKDAGESKALSVCRSYAEAFDDNRARGSSLILCGHTGTGKTHLAASIAVSVIKQGKSALYTTIGRMFRTVKDTYRKSSEMTEQAAIDTYAIPDLLVIDEVGVQYGSDTERMILFDVVNARYEALKPTILVSNLAMAALAEYVGDRVIDRMKENGGKIVIFDWKSHRGAA